MSRAWKRLGIGRALMEMFLEEMRAARVEWAFLHAALPGSRPRRIFFGSGRWWGLTRRSPAPCRGDKDDVPALLVAGTVSAVVGQGGLGVRQGVVDDTDQVIGESRSSRPHL